MKPTDDTIALVAFLLDGDWRPAEDLREGLARLGFRRPSNQWRGFEDIRRLERRSPQPEHLREGRR